MGGRVGGGSYSGKFYRVVVSYPCVRFVYVCGQEEESKRVQRG